MMTTAVEAVRESIVDALMEAGRMSEYSADANEPDPRYRSYGVRATARDRIIRDHRREIRALSPDEQLTLATRLIASGYGEQQSVAFFVLQQMGDYFHPGNLEILDGLIRRLYGWSKIDGFTGSILQDLLFKYPESVIERARAWNRDPELWLRRASVVLFTRRVAASGRFNDIALELCHNLVLDGEPMVQKGVGWTLKDLMTSDKQRIIAYVKELRAAGVSSVITLYAIRNLKGAERQGVLDVKPRR